jgi:hypothetical protein
MNRIDRKLIERKVLGELLTGKYSHQSLPVVPRQKRREAARIEAKAIARAMIKAKEVNTAVEDTKTATVPIKAITDTKEAVVKSEAITDTMETVPNAKI